MLHLEEARVRATASPRQAARDAKKALLDLARPAQSFDFSRYFRASGDLGFHNTGQRCRDMGARRRRSTRRTATSGRSISAIEFADLLVADRHLETKAVGMEVLARYPSRTIHAATPTGFETLARRRSRRQLGVDRRVVRRVAGTAARAAPGARAAAVVLVASSQHVGAASVSGRLDRVRTEGSGAGFDLRQRRPPARRQRGSDPESRRLDAARSGEAGHATARSVTCARARAPSIPRTTLRYAIERFPDCEAAGGRCWPRRENGSRPALHRRHVAA